MAAGAVDKRSLLSKCALFRDIDDRDLDALAAYARFQRYAAHEVIFRKGDPGHGLMAVVSGRVGISSLSDEGKEVILNMIGPGEVFGEIALLDGKERTADATAMETSDLLVLDRRGFVSFLKHEPDFCVALLNVLCARIRRTSEQVEDSLFLDLPARLGKALLALADNYGRATPDGIRLEIKLSQRELGNLVGLTRESMNKQLMSWREQGLITITKGLITIRDLEAFQTAIHDSSQEHRMGDTP